MDTLDVIQLVTSKVFHDMGNSITALSLLSSTSQDSNIQASAVQELVERFKLLREVFVSTEDETDLSSCSKLLSQYFKGKKVTINSLVAEKHIPSDAYQVILNLVMSVGAAISHYGDIIVDFDDKICRVNATGKGIVNRSFEYVMKNQLDKVEINTNNIQSYITLLLIQKGAFKINCTYNNNSFDIVLSWD